MEPNDDTFFHGFASLDVGTNGNSVVASTVSQRNIELGEISDQVVFGLDFSVGVWLYRNRDAQNLTGVAAQLELHYRTTIQDADEVGGVVDTVLLEFGSGRNRSDVIDLTFALHFEIQNDTAFRIGTSVPLREAPDRNFDAEVLFQLVHRFGATQTRPRTRNSTLDRLFLEKRRLPATE